MGQSRIRWRRVATAVLAAGAAGAAVAVAELGIIGGAVLREAYRYPKPVDDGPDPLLETPVNSRSSVVGTSDGTLLHVAVSGDVATADEVVILVHGWTCNTTFWNPQIGHFGGRRAAVAYDQRGHGLSEMGPTTPSIELLGQDLQAVIEEMVPEGKRAVLVGHSMGGMAILSWAAQFGAGMEEKIAAIVMTSTSAFGVVQRQLLVPETLPAVAKPFEPFVERAFVSTPLPLPANSAIAERITHYVALGPVARQAHVDFSDEMIAGCSPSARAAWGSAMFSLDVRAGLDKITVPTAVVVGTEDRLTSPEHAEDMATVLRRKGVLHSYTEYPGAGHMVPIERATQYNRLLDQVLADVTSTHTAEA